VADRVQSRGVGRLVKVQIAPIPLFLFIGSFVRLMGLVLTRPQHRGTRRQPINVESFVVKGGCWYPRCFRASLH
jgi:hypothetical protein